MELGLRTLLMPLNELEDRLLIFDKKISEINEERKYTQDTLAGEKKRILEFLEEQAQNLREKSRLHFEEVVDKALAASSSKINEKAALKALSDDVPVFFENELRVMSQEFDSRVTAILQKYQRRADNLTNSIRITAAELFNIPYHAPQSSDALEFKKEPYWVARKWSQNLLLIPVEWVDSLLPPRLREKRVRKRLHDEIKALVLHNVENLRWATLQNLNTAFLRFRGELDRQLQQTITATQGAIKAAYHKRRLHEDEVSPEVKRIKTALAKLTEITEDFLQLFK